MRLLPILLVLGALIAGFPATVAAQTAQAPTEAPAFDLDRWDSEASAIEKRLAEDPPDAVEIEEMRQVLDSQRAAILSLAETAEIELKPLRKQLKALGDPPEDPAAETQAIADERKRLTEVLAEKDARLKRAGQAEVRAATLHTRLTELRRHLFSERMLSRGPGLVEPQMLRKGAAAIGRTVSTIKLESTYRFEHQRVSTSSILGLLAPVLIALAAWLLLLAARRAAISKLVRLVDPEAPRSRRVAIAIGIIIARLLLPAAALAAVVFGIDYSDLLGPRGEAVLAGLARAAALVIAAYALGGAFFAPHAPALRLSQLQDYAAIHAHRWLIALAAVVGLDRATVITGRDLGMEIEGLSLLNSGLLVLGGISLWRFIHFVQPLPEQTAVPEDGEYDGIVEEEAPRPLMPVLRNALVWVARLAGLAAPLLAIAGYFAASRYAFYPLVASGGLIGIFILLFHAVREVLWLVTDPDSKVLPEKRKFSLTTCLVGFLLTCAAVPLLAMIWGADRTDIGQVWRVITEGFSVGEIVISPLAFLTFLLVFSIGYMLARIVQGVLSRSILPLTKLDAGGRAAVSTGVFYIGVVLAALAAISVTGLDLSNLAIVAGALSVGIGFGLQNIVNNFVSGLILLVERPIKAGDWIELASGMGYVKQVNVRSTEIQTFDRASLFVPNSELISSSVTNWTHSNLNGRIIVPIGVAYGTDPKQVETILLEIAKAHPMLLRHPAPYVLFRRFGADSLDFEIRGVLRDVNWILNVTSEINFEISRRFADEGIEIPFAQRDLHLRNAGELGQSIGDALRGEQAPQAEAAETPSQPRPPSGRLSGSSEAAGNEPDGDV